MKLILTVGVPASGKTTWAEEYCRLNQNTVNINRDDTRQALFGPFKPGEYLYKKADEALVTKANKDKALVALGRGQDVIISDTNLTPDRRQVWESIAEQYDAEYEMRLFHISFDEASRRDQAREMKVGNKVLQNMFKTYHSQNRDLIVADFKLKLENTWVINDKPCVLSDIDGTVAEMHKGQPGKRSPFEWLRVGEDTPRPNVLNVLRLLSEEYPIIFISGRDGVCVHQTSDWLGHYAEYYETLVMRGAGDSRPDWVIKLELLRDLALDGWSKPTIMFDDRDQVVNTMRDVGIEVFQVQPGNF
ncbi:HAD-like domain protein [Vibrio phage 1.081.O._10N.286.52.C2]|nr:HAD-like domain protein [Vibrio phage 1.081.O._10N.286.52.C2]